MIKVLVADDHAIFRQGLISVLGQFPEFQVVGHASNGSEAVAKASELQPDVVIMDISMPGSGGVEATMTLQQTRPQTRVLILTVSEERRDLFTAIKAGAKGYLLKSVGLEELVNAVRLVANGEAIVSPFMAVMLLDEFKQTSGDKAKKEVSELSPRESEILKLVARGATNGEIAAQLFISETTVKAHLRSILEKLQVKNRAQAVAYAAGKGWLQDKR
jgi:two-component system NarL family response regulator